MSDLRGNKLSRCFICARLAIVGENVTLPLGDFMRYEWSPGNAEKISRIVAAREVAAQESPPFDSLRERKHGGTTRAALLAG